MYEDILIYGLRLTGVEFHARMERGPVYRATLAGPGGSLVIVKHPSVMSLLDGARLGVNLPTYSVRIGCDAPGKVAV